MPFGVFFGVNVGKTGDFIKGVVIDRFLGWID